MSSINSLNNVSFGAKLNIVRISQDKERWQNIAQLFEKRTEDKQPDTTLYLSDKDNGLAIENHKNLDFYCRLKNDAYEKLMNLNDEIIVKKLTKVMNLGVKADMVNKEIEDVGVKFELDDDRYDKFYDRVKSQLNIENREELDKDRLFKGCDFVC